MALPADSSRVIAKLSRLTQRATDRAVRLAEDLAEQQDAKDWRQLSRRMAWQLVQRRSTVQLRSPFQDHDPVSVDDPATEFRAGLLHEMALRFGLGRSRDNYLPYQAYGARLRELRHPSAWLTLNSLHFEGGMRSGSWIEGSSPASHTPETLRAAYPEVPPTEGGASAGRAARRVPDDARAAAAARGFSQLAEYEAAFYILPEPVDRVDFNTALLAELDADSLHALTPDTLTTVHTTADDLARELFAADFGGGLWGEAQYGAYARLHTWQSLYALMDIAGETSQYDAVRLAAGHCWLRFAVPQYTDNRWFVGDMTDIAFACLDLTRTRIAILAATETD
ncbi:DUF6183 family protein [Streptomyces sp. WM6386]|uniref:DUF6183 family protein n=1 Tax=Streptomyces sp. WM6386 TaxID=1415558 RepID=UPI000696E829|nr:DUF6183 family protein [Streptomyces sp. WM6386]